MIGVLKTIVLTSELLHMINTFPNGADLFICGGHLLTCWTHLHGCIILLREDVWAHKTTISLPHLIVMTLPNKR